jgi:branched-chain amino acid transport system ATP-binding protein
MNEPLLELQHVSLYFGGLSALEDISFTLPSGQVAALIGPNGAGKTSLFNCLTGFYQPQQGIIRFRGKDITGLKPHAVARRGMGRSFQNIELFRSLTSLDNLLLGRHMHVRTNLFGAIFATPGWVRDEVRQRRKAEELLELLDLQAYRHQPVGALPYGVQKLIEVARALAAEPRLLLLDEPTAGMTADEKDDMMHNLQRLCGELDLSMLVVEHDLRVVSRLAERVLVLDYGRLIADGTPHEVQEQPEVIRAYLGDLQLARQASP